ncbi:SH3 domain-containing protein [Acinetobacter baumannii]|uniref:SH3 domain-containing protein n=1 Tax=Acinetobacter baumannii TaxID=470 RepID=UPI00244A95A9|nr:SH3 domain-containing protein [Acinetobacter baumannii]MDH2544182.1 SH3 domain-containing protein [Acinetobacter baumannii]
MTHDNNFKRIAITPSEFNKVVKAFNSLQHNENVVKTMEKFIEDKNFYIDYSVKKKAPSFDLKLFDDFITNTHLKNFGLSSLLKEMQNNDIELTSLINNSELIKNFFNGDLGIFSIQENSQQSDLNIFGEKINPELNIKDNNYNSYNQIDFSKIRKDAFYLILLFISFYLQNLDQAHDSQEAIYFFINNIDCKAATISRINLRTEPSFSSNIIIEIPKDSILKVYNNSQNGWVKVQVNINNIDVEGYVSEAYIRRLE